MSPSLAATTPAGRAAFLEQVDGMVKMLRDQGAPEPFTCNFKPGAIDDETAQALRERGFIVKIEP